MMMDVLYTSLLLGAVLFTSWLVVDGALRGKMQAFYVISGVIALGLLVYVVAVLLMPEKFG
jgi:K+-transporting ATPase KdpF subunit